MSADFLLVLKRLSLYKQAVMLVAFLNGVHIKVHVAHFVKNHSVPAECTPKARHGRFDRDAIAV